MGLYTISITPEDGTGATTTITVDVDQSRKEPRITELTVRSADGTGLLPQHLPAIDLELLLRAVGPASGAVATAASAARGKRARASARQRSEAGSKDAAQRRRSSRADTAKSTLGGREYRRMPDDLAEVYEQLQGVTAVARHYGVPRHTAQGWMNRLRGRA